MSYVRWSTEIHNVMPLSEEMRLMVGKQWTYEDIKKEKLKRGGEISCWYIYYTTHSGDTKEDQAVSINLAGGESVVLTYDDVVSRMERDYWDDLFPDRPQRDVFDSALKSWIEDVEEEYQT